jgi:hypothetical protein
MISFIPPPNTLKGKIAMDGSDGIDEAILKRAETAIENMSDEIFRMDEIMLYIHRRRMQSP